MQNTIKILITLFVLLFWTSINSFAQQKKQNEKEEVVQVEGVYETLKVLGGGLWFELKKKLNLIDEEELKKKKTYKVKVGKIIIEKQRSS